MQKRLPKLLAILVMFSFFLPGCYYFSARKEIKGAEKMFSELKAQGGQKLVPYEYCSAEKFLENAKGESDENDFKQAKDFAIRSKSAAQAGLTEIQKKKK